MISAKKIRERRHSYYLEIIQNKIFDAESEGIFEVEYVLPKEVDKLAIIKILLDYDYRVEYNTENKSVIIWW